jgi:hypothetical protein
MKNTVHTIKANGFTVELEKGGTFASFNTLGWIAYYLGPDGIRRAFQTYSQLAYAKEAAPVAALKIHALYAPKPATAPVPVPVASADMDLMSILFGN